MGYKGVVRGGVGVGTRESVGVCGAVGVCGQ
jgi:hypothetical protein